MSNSLIREDKMEQRWFNPRLNYLRTIIKPLPKNCPECEHSLEHEGETIFCPHCGLITYTSIEYVAGQKIDLPSRH